ncbi:MAG: hypothetical protein SOT46_11185 [Treponema sp.]|nr:hypothetical protein [Treponema sp.]
MISFFRPPVAGEKVHVICKNCGYSGMGKLADTSPLRITTELENTKCPKCGKNKLIINPFVMY